jgi:hypothetical protein
MKVWIKNILFSKLNIFAFVGALTLDVHPTLNTESCSVDVVIARRAGANNKCFAHYGGRDSNPGGKLGKLES